MHRTMINQLSHSSQTKVKQITPFSAWFLGSSAGLMQFMVAPINKASLCSDVLVFSISISWVLLCGGTLTLRSLYAVVIKCYDAEGSLASGQDLWAWGGRDPGMPGGGGYFWLHQLDKFTLLAWSSPSWNWLYDWNHKIYLLFFIMQT